MSADLFAEFNDLSNKPAPGQVSSSTEASNHPKASAQPQNWTHDLLGFGQEAKPTKDADFSQWVSSSHEPGRSINWASTGQPSQDTVQTATDDDDGWGDFETAEPAAKSSASVAKLPDYNTSDLSLGLMSGPAASLPMPGLQKPNHAAPAPSLHVVHSMNRSTVSEFAPSRPALKDPNVLFDADDFELQGADADDDDGDDFGDFAGSTSLPPKPRPSDTIKQELITPMNLLDIEDVPSSGRSPQLSAPRGALTFGASSANSTTLSKARESRDQHSRPASSLMRPEKADVKKEPASVSRITLKTVASSASTIANQPDGDDGWGAWDDISGGDNSTELAPSGPETRVDWGRDDSTKSKPSTAEKNNDGPPPVNVPPPSVILSIFTGLFISANTPLKSITTHSGPARQRVLSDPKTTQFLRGFILLGTIAARVIAGRKHRWHRDKILAKSMSISAAGSKGMKLAGVDKSQSTRENNEASDVIASWREHVGRLRSAVAAANTTCGLNLKVPELSEAMQTHAAKSAPTARSPCVICGLKREERVAKVDFDVEDSFGEWWVEHWGHRSCKNFWLEHEERLRQR